MTSRQAPLSAGLRGKTILVLSQQSWGTMRVSKHHYAVELAKRGNQVYFLDPPNRAGLFGRTRIRVREEGERLRVIEHRPAFSYRLKFHAPRLYSWAMRRHLRRICASLPSRIDVVWSFDMGALYPLAAFGPRTLKIFHPVDEPLNEEAFRSAEGATAMFSVTQEIVDRYKARLSVPAYFINHGLAEEFLPLLDEHSTSDGVVRVGLSGNLLRRDIDHAVLLEIVRQNPDVVFECWGTYSRSHSNLPGGEDPESRAFVDALRAQPNVVLHGPVAARELVAGYRRMDAFLICYDVQKDQSRGTNYHKVMEFLASGKAIISNNITTYAARGDLVRMVTSRDHNRDLPELFGSVLRNLPEHNHVDLQRVRREFARANTYANQLDRIAHLLSEHGL